MLTCGFPGLRADTCEAVPGRQRYERWRQAMQGMAVVTSAGSAVDPLWQARSAASPGMDLPGRPLAPLQNGARKAGYISGMENGGSSHFRRLYRGRRGHVAAPMRAGVARCYFSLLTQPGH